MALFLHIDRQKEIHTILKNMVLFVWKGRTSEHHFTAYDDHGDFPVSRHTAYQEKPEHRA